MVDTYFSLVILCYRGEDSIVPFIEKAHQMLSQYQFSWELVLVANYFEGRGDKTPEVMHTLAKRLPNIQVIARPKSGMMGWDLRTGLDAAQGEYIGLIDGDGQFPIEAVASSLAKIQLENLDLVKTYRIQRDDGLYRKLVSSVYNGLFRLLFSRDIRDANSKPKVIRRAAYKKLDLKSDDWFIDAEMMIKASRLGFKIGEIPIQFHAHTVRGSFVRPAAIIEFIQNMFRARFGKSVETAPPLLNSETHEQNG